MNKDNTCENHGIRFMRIEIIRTAVNEFISKVKLQRKVRQSNQPQPKHQGFSKNNKKHSIILTLFYSTSKGKPVTRESKNSSSVILANAGRPNFDLILT